MWRRQPGCHQPQPRQMLRQRPPPQEHSPQSCRRYRDQKCHPNRLEVMALGASQVLRPPYPLSFAWQAIAQQSAQRGSKTERSTAYRATTAASTSGLPSRSRGPALWTSRPTRNPVVSVTTWRSRPCSADPQLSLLHRVLRRRYLPVPAKGRLLMRPRIPPPPVW